MGKVTFTYKDFSDAEMKDIVEMYKNGYSTVKIGEKYNIGNKSIAKVLDIFGIKRIRNGVRKYKLDEHYFDFIDTPNKAYCLGLLYADGSNYPPKQTISISLEEHDKYILERMREELKSGKELEYLDYSNKNDYGYNYSNQYRLSVHSKHMSDELEHKGMVKSKSLVLEFPKFIDEEFIKYFILGYFDGDGSYCPHYLKSGKFQPLITFTSTESFCKDLQTYLRNKLGIPCGNIYDASCHNGITKVLSFSGTKQVKTFLDWLYTDADMYLPRKYEKYKNSYDNIVIPLSVQRTDKVT